MTIPIGAVPQPLGAPSLRVPFVDPQTGILTSHGQQIVSDAINYVKGGSRVIPCNATGTNIIALTMMNVAPKVDHYNDYDVFQFVAAATSTGTVTANVTNTQGTLATLKVFKSNGAAQATTGDIVSGSFYTFTYVDTLDSGNGGFVLK